jgi:hypothetical protein
MGYTNEILILRFLSKETGIIGDNVILKILKKTKTGDSWILKF